MTDPPNRYPGAQPFSDDEFSRKVFFGRDSAARELADKILANHVVTVYARSGLGKTSLLKAGVAPLLRDQGYLPLFVRVNDLRVGPYPALLETVPDEAARQQIEYVPGRGVSLWSFFKTAEFWRDDLLLTPVLILDQFEELFTLQSEEVRAHFLNELSYLIRGVRPPPYEVTPPVVGRRDDVGAARRGRPAWRNRGTIVDGQHISAHCTPRRGAAPSRRRRATINRDIRPRRRRLRASVSGAARTDRGQRESFRGPGVGSAVRRRSAGR